MQHTGLCFTDTENEREISEMEINLHLLVGMK